MSKRFTDTEKWKKPFIKGLSTINKLFFLYILDDCDHAGIWHVEPEIASIRIGEQIDIEHAKKEFDKHIIEFDNQAKWLIPYFIEFQYGKLNPAVNAHKSVIVRLEKYSLNKRIQQFMNSSQTVMDMDKDLDKDKKGARFDEIWAKYPNKDGKKKSHAHFTASVKNDEDWGNINKALDNYLKCEKVQSGFIKVGPTWFNNWRDWIDYEEPKRNEGKTVLKRFSEKHGV